MTYILKALKYRNRSSEDRSTEFTVRNCSFYTSCGLPRLPCRPLPTFQHSLYGMISSISNGPHMKANASKFIFAQAHRRLAFKSTEFSVPLCEWLGVWVKVVPLAALWLLTNFHTNSQIVSHARRPVLAIVKHL